MDERKDPMALWTGTWTPQDVIDREVQRLTPPAPSASQEQEATKRDTTS